MAQTEKDILEFLIPYIRSALQRAEDDAEIKKHTLLLRGLRRRRLRRKARGGRDRGGMVGSRERLHPGREVRDASAGELKQNG